ncbi:permease [Candidatus Falkowbacteria bacterium RBG_13_39_14]|uniref:Permease n=1 Tax=Candidatus Falkowbacteria bacterium RBG_13_39_14 TaxID=1797985 RepID=A0A1F5S6D8_9BACT|nr:MAG: permease [Candidatus Falkowbacteria bacterium RBG_13_39_14]
MNLGIIFAISGAVIAVIMAGIGSIFGVKLIGEIGAGVISEDPEKFGKILLLEALPGTQGIYGFLTAIMVMLKVGLLGGEVVVSTSVGIQLLLACLPICFTGLFSALMQAKVGAAGVNIVAKQPAASGKALVLAAMVETYAVLGLLASVLLINGIKL